MEDAACQQELEVSCACQRPAGATVDTRLAAATYLGMAIPMTLRLVKEVLDIQPAQDRTRPTGLRPLTRDLRCATPRRRQAPRPGLWPWTASWAGEKPPGCCWRTAPDRRLCREGSDRAKTARGQARLAAPRRSNSGLRRTPAPKRGSGARLQQPRNHVPRRAIPCNAKRC